MKIVCFCTITIKNYSKSLSVWNVVTRYSMRFAKRKEILIFGTHPTARDYFLIHNMKAQHTIPICSKKKYFRNQHGQCN